MDRRDAMASRGDGYTPCPERMRNRLSRGPMQMQPPLSKLTERSEDTHHPSPMDRRATIRERSRGSPDAARERSRGPNLPGTAHSQALAARPPPPPPAPPAPHMSGTMPHRPNPQMSATVPPQSPLQNPRQRQPPASRHAGTAAAATRSRRPSVTLPPEDPYQTTPESESEYSSNLSANTQATSAPSLAGPAAKPLYGYGHRNVRARAAPIRKNISVVHHVGKSKGSSTRSRVSAPGSSHRTIRIQVQPGHRRTQSLHSSVVDQHAEESFKEEIVRLKKEAKMLQERTENSKKDLETALDKLSSMQLQRYEAQRERDQERLWRDNLHHDFDARGKMIEALRMRIDERDRAILDRDSRIMEGNQTLERMKTDLDARGAAVDQLRQQLEEQGKKASEQEAKMGELTGMIETHKEMIDKLGIEKEALEKVKDDLMGQCAELKSTVREMEMKNSQEEVLMEKVTALELTREGLKAQISALESQKGIHELEMADLKKERDGLAAESEKHAAEAKALAAEKGALEAEKENLATKIADVEGENGELKGKVESLETAKADVDAQLTTTTTERDALKKQSEEQAAELTKLRDSEAALTAETEALKGENVTLKEEGETLRTNLATTTENLEAMTKRADEQTGRADRLDAQCKGLASELLDTNVRLKNLHEVHSQRLDEIEELKADVKNWKKKATTRPKQEDFVMVRDKENRGTVKVIKKTDLRRSISRAPRSRTRSGERSASESKSDTKSIRSDSDSE